MNNNKYYLALICLLLISIILLGSVFIASRTSVVSVFGDESEANSTAQAMAVIEAKSGRLLCGKNVDVQLPMASTTKIMTALLALENIKNIDEPVKIYDQAIGIEGTSIYLRKNDELTTRELVYGLMLASGNDASIELANLVGEGDCEKFVEMMNDKAIEIGANNTHFDNPHGLDSATHYTSARDLALITAKALENETFKEICSTKFKQINGNDEVGNRFLRNKQKLLHTYQNCIGVKTGFTDKAGRCSVAAVEQNNMVLICVVLNCADMFDETSRILDEVFEEYTMTEILPEYNFTTSISVVDGSSEKVRVFSKSNFEYPLKEDEIEKIDIKHETVNYVTAPVEKEQVVGNIKIYLNNDLIFSEDLYTIDSVDSTKLSDKIKSVLDNWFVD